VIVTATAIELDGGPRVELLDATAWALTEPALRRLARSRSGGARCNGEHVSRSYCFPYALVGRHGDRVGVDIERVVACDEAFARSICTPAEEARAPWGSDRQIISLWSGKEALAKALGDAVAYDPRRLDSPAGWADGAAGPWRAGAIPVPDGYCAWACWRVSAGD